MKSFRPFRPFNEENLKESERFRKKQKILSNSQKTLTKDFAKRHPRVGLNMKETLSEPERPSNSKFRAAYLLRRSCFESLYLYKLSRFWEHVAIMNLKSREYQNIILSSKSLRHHTSQLSRELNKSWAKIYLKKSQKIIYWKFVKTYSSDHTTSYPRRLEPHNLELFRIDVTNCLEIFCETCSSMFSVLKLTKRIFHSTRALINHHPRIFTK